MPKTQPSLVSALSLGRVGQSAAIDNADAGGMWLPLGGHQRKREMGESGGLQGGGDCSQEGFREGEG